MSEVYLPFDIAEHAAFNEWIAPLFPLGFRRDLCQEHDEAPEVIEVSLPRASAPSFHLWRTQEGVVLCDMDDGGRAAHFPTIRAALDDVLRRLGE